MGLSRKQVSSDVQDQSQGLLQSSSADSGSGSEKLKCPRCDSANTKFCYYNNYNKSQPRYLCKGCKRHWTKGGMLRNVPVGGGKKNKRLKTSPNTNTTPNKISITNALQGTSFGLELDGENNTMRKTLNEGPQYLLQDTIFNTNTNQDLEFPCPSFEYNFPCNSVDQTPHLYALNNGASNVLDDTEIMTLTALDDKAWLSYDSSTNWGWDEMDKFVISDVTIPWDDDAEIN